MAKLRVCAYCRVSTDSEQQEKSFEAQQSYFNREIKAKGHILVNVYGDEGETGTKLNNRKQFNQMLYDAGIDVVESYRSDAKMNRYGNIDRRLKKKHVNYEESDRKPLFDEIWIKNTSRFARNTFSFHIIEILRNKGVHIYFLEQNINTGEISADFLLKLFQLFDEQESRDKSSKVKFGQKERAKTKNTISTTKKIYGYHYAKQTNSLEIIEEEAEVIRYIYKLYLEGYGIRRIINELSDEKNNMFTRNKKPFSISTIRRILSNEKYCGTNVRFKYTYGNVFNKASYAHINDEEKWVVVKNHDRIPPIISEDTFNKAQEILRGNTFHQSQKGVYKGISKYAGLIYCENCGAVYYSNVDRGRRYYNCSTKKKMGAKVCNYPNISEDKIKAFLSKDEISSSLLWYIMQQKRMLNNLIGMLQEQYSLDNTEKVKELTMLVDELLAKKSKYVELYTDAIISKDELTQKVEPINTKIAELKGLIEITGKRNNELDSDILEAQNAIVHLTKEHDRITKEYMTNTGMFKDNGCINEIEKIIVMEDGSLEAEYKIVARLSEQFSKYNVYLKDLKNASKC